MSKETKYKVIVISISGHGKKIHNYGDLLSKSDLIDPERMIKEGYVESVGAKEKATKKSE